MSRIDEAMRRAGPAVSTAVTAERNDVFVSAWVGGDRAPETPAVPAAPGGSRDDRSPGQLPVPANPMALPADRFRPDWRERLVSPGAVPALVDQFRRLAAALIHSQRGARLKVLMVTSAVPQEGKTLTALNLALVLSESYRRRVLLIDGDLRRPRIGEAANLAVSEGLGEAISASDARKLSVVPLTETLTLLPAGRPDPDPLSGVTSALMRQLLEEAAERFDWVIVDTPPVNAAADAGLLSAIVDAVLLVVRAGQTPYEAVRHAIDTLGRDRIFGVLMNGAEERAVPASGVYADDDSMRVQH